ncbi:MAG: hypothetical protein JXA25_09745 [Anaerolineales bacterium]|nr:hypothetical protein [Anaerolineales bacterium]
MLGPIVTQLQRILERKASKVQRAFLEMSQELETLSKNTINLTGEEHQATIARQNTIRDQQQGIAEEINRWREYGRLAIQQGTEERMRSYIQEIQEKGDDELIKELEDLIFQLDHPEEILKRLEEANQRRDSGTPVGRLIERASTVYDMRSENNSARKEAAFEFANRQGVIQDEDILAELESYIDDEDPYIQETAQLTVIQIYRLKALQLADIRESHKAVKRLTEISNPAVVPALVEIMEKPRKGYLERDGAVVEVDNVRSRQIALLRLVEWHTAEAQRAIYMRRFDQNKDIVSFVEKALEMFPEEWDGTLPKSEGSD